MYAIEIENLSKTYFDKKFKKVEALKSLHLEVAQGEVMGFLGPNGAGKSTTIKTVVGLIKPTAGTVRILGEPVTDPVARFHVGFLPENPAFYDFLNAREYLLFVGRTFKMSGQALAQRCEEALQLVDLFDASKRPIRTYSKGMVQRLGIAQTWVHDPDIFILDEPMSGLDPIGRSLVKRIIQDLKGQGKTVFFSTHITSDVESICDRVAILKNGELQSVDTVADIFMQGILGYDLHLRQNDGLISDSFVEKQELSAALAQASKDQAEVVLVEPRRKTLEQYFLDTIGTA